MAKGRTKLRGIVILLLGASLGLFPVRALPIPSLRALSFKQAVNHPPLKPQRLRVFYSGPRSVSTCRQTVVARRLHAHSPGLARNAARSNVPAVCDFPALGTAAPLGHPLRC
jgi:hypothetical protein